MKKKWNRLKEIIRLFRLDMIFLIVGLYFALCFSIYLILRLEDMETPFWDVVCFNLLTVTGNDYIYVDSPWARVMGIFMLIPAELFKFTRPLLPESGFAPIQVVVAVAYVLAAIGMYGMFYPWRIEKLFGIGDGKEHKPGGETEGRQEA